MQFHENVTTGPRRLWLRDRVRTEVNCGPNRSQQTTENDATGPATSMRTVPNAYHRAGWIDALSFATSSPIRVLNSRNVSGAPPPPAEPPAPAALASLSTPISEMARNGRPLCRETTSSLPAVDLLT